MDAFVGLKTLIKIIKHVVAFFLMMEDFYKKNVYFFIQIVLTQEQMKKRSLKKRYSWVGGAELQWGLFVFPTAHFESTSMSLITKHKKSSIKGSFSIAKN